MNTTKVYISVLKMIMWRWTNDYEGISIEKAKEKAIKQACIDYDVGNNGYNPPYIALVLTSDSPINQEEYNM